MHRKERLCTAAHAAVRNRCALYMTMTTRRTLFARRKGRQALLFSSLRLLYLSVFCVRPYGGRSCTAWRGQSGLQECQRKQTSSLPRCLAQHAPRSRRSPVSCRAQKEPTPEAPALSTPDSLLLVSGAVAAPVSLWSCVGSVIVSIHTTTPNPHPCVRYHKLVVRLWKCETPSTVSRIFSRRTPKKGSGAAARSQARKTGWTPAP